MRPEPERSLGLATLDEALRTVVRDELALAGFAPKQPKPGPPTPTKSDLLLLSVVAADCALILVLVPSLENSAVETFLKVVQWTGATVFVAAATWFQDQFLAFTRGMTFRAVAVATLLLLLPQKVPMVPILVPRAAENVSELKFDTDSILDVTGRRMVTLASHTMASTTIGQACSLETQPALTMRVTELWSAIRSQRIVPVYYKVNATFPRTGSPKHLHIRRQDAHFMADDLQILRASLVEHKAGRMAESAGARDVAVSFGSNEGAAYVELPGGSYDLELTTPAGECLGRVSGVLTTVLGDACLIQLAVGQCRAAD